MSWEEWVDHLLETITSLEESITDLKYETNRMDDRIYNLEREQ